MPEGGGQLRVGRMVAGGVAAGVLTVGVFMFLLARFDLDDEVLELLRWVDAQGLWAPLLFMSVMAAAVVLLLPGILLTTGAGFMFGVVMGSLYVVAGTTAGAAVAFVLARRFLGARAARYLRDHPRVRMLDSDLAPDGWKVVFLCRLVPFFPSKLANYFFGLTSVSLPAFALGTGVGIVPYTVHNVYLGAIAAELARHQFRPGDISGERWLMYGVGLLAAVTAMVWLGRRATRALERGGGAAPPASDVPSGRG